jgi:hypothetical protein
MPPETQRERDLKPKQTYRPVSIVNYATVSVRKPPGMIESVATLAVCSIGLLFQGLFAVIRVTGKVVIVIAALAAFLAFLFLAITGSINTLNAMQTSGPSTLLGLIFIYLVAFRD